MTIFVFSISFIVLGFGIVGILALLNLINFVLWFDNLNGNRQLLMEYCVKN